MLKLITWKAFIGGTLILAAIYYLVIFIIYYKKGFKILQTLRSRSEFSTGEAGIGDLRETKEQNNATD